MNKNIVIGILVLIIIFIGGYAIWKTATPAPVTQITNNSQQPTPNHSSQTSINLSTFSSQYISPNFPPDPWPPVVQHNSTTYSCSTLSRDVFGTLTNLTGTQKTINGRAFCFYSFADGGAGSYSGVYTYTTAELNGSGTERVDFRSSWHNCDGYGSAGDPQYDQCKIDQSTFFNNIDAYIASLM